MTKIVYSHKTLVYHVIVVLPKSSNSILNYCFKGYAELETDDNTRNGFFSSILLNVQEAGKTHEVGVA